MVIKILVEGRTEAAFKPHLTTFLRNRLDRLPRLDFFPYDGRIPKAEKLRRVVQNLLKGKVAAVIALTDVYTGSDDFSDAADARRKMREWVGPEKRFHPHAAQHDFEAWLLPYWATIQNLAGHNRKAPSRQPEQVNHQKPPSYHIKEIFRTGKYRNHYSKVRDGKRILDGQDLTIAANQCPELKAFLNTILTLSGGQPI